MNGRAQLARLLSAVESGRRVPADVVAWLFDGLEAFEDGQELAGALGLRTTAQLRELRDGHLQAAARLMPATWSTSQRARRMRSASRGLEPHLMTGADHLDGWQAELFLALQAGPLPGDRRLRAIVGTAGPDCQKAA